MFFVSLYHGLTPVAKNVSPAARATDMKALWDRDKQPPQGAKLLISHGRLEDPASDGSPWSKDTKSIEILRRGRDIIHPYSYYIAS